MVSGLGSANVSMVEESTAGGSCETDRVAIYIIINPDSAVRFDATKPRREPRARREDRAGGKMRKPKSPSPKDSGVTSLGKDLIVRVRCSPLTTQLAAGFELH